MLCFSSGAKDRGWVSAATAPPYVGSLQFSSPFVASINLSSSERNIRSVANIIMHTSISEIIRIYAEIAESYVDDVYNYMNHTLPANGGLQLYTAVKIAF